MGAAESKAIASQLAADLVDVQADYLREFSRARRSRALRTALQTFTVVAAAGVAFGILAPTGQAWAQKMAPALSQLSGFTLPEGPLVPAIALGIIGVIVAAIAYIIITRSRQPGLAVDKVGIVNLPILEARTSNRETMYVDLSGITSPSELRYFPANAIDALEAQLEGIPAKEAANDPLLDTEVLDELGSDGPDGSKARIFGSEASLRRAATSLGESLKRTAWLSDSLPLLEPDGPLASLARVLLDNGDHVDPAFSPRLAPAVVEADEVRKVLARAFPSGVGSDASDERGVQRIDALRRHIEQVAEEFSRHRDRTLNWTLPFQENKVFEAADVTSYVFYCPSCNADRIERLAETRAPDDPLPPDTLSFNPSSRMKLDAASGDWVCPLCETRSDTPFPVHRLLDQLLHPLFDRLILQNQVERTKLYARAKEDKRHHQVEFDREIAELKRQHMTADQGSKRQIRELRANLEGQLVTVESLAQALQRVQKHFAARLDEVQREFLDIRHRTIEQADRAIASLDQHYAAQNARFDRTMAKFAAAAKREDRARMQVLQAIAKNTHAAAQAQQRVASATERSALANETSARAAIKSTAVQKAMAHKQGLDKPKPLNFPGQVAHGYDSARRFFSGKSDVAYEEQKLKG